MKAKRTKEYVYIVTGDDLGQRAEKALAEIRKLMEGQE